MPNASQPTRKPTSTIPTPPISTFDLTSVDYAYTPPHGSAYWTDEDEPLAAIRRDDRPTPPAKTSPSVQPRRRRRVRPRWIKWPFLLFCSFQVLCFLLNVIAPPRTLFMLTDPNSDIPFAYDYVELDHISRWLPAAFILHEDAEFGTRSLPFDIDHFMNRVNLQLDGAKDTSGSTIQQQLAKNIFLTRWHNPIRKAFEVPIAFSVNYLVADQRKIELYMNFAQFAPNLYGVCAATWYYFGSAPWDISRDQAIRLAGLLPSGDFARRGPSGGIDLSNSESSATQTVWRALQLLPDRFDARKSEAEPGDEWLPILEPIGITDSAEDHASDRNDKQSCSSQPNDVAERIAWETERENAGIHQLGSP